MSYAGRDPRSRHTTSTAANPASARAGRASARAQVLDREISIGSRGASRPIPAPSPQDEHELDWQHIAIFAAGALLGAAVGAGAALLLAPQSGARTRHNLARRGRHLASRTGDAWEDLRHELHFAARRGRRKLHRALHDRRARRAVDGEMLVDD